ncbi:hypothetical protein VKT23_009769 [Stygiomarasmius scandens]|uniref:Uncharacterized protein n=1 Tax=Marasmiellus scandens TaxID=2682957 RepID=A0ABR1JFR2_9AGAR
MASSGPGRCFSLPPPPESPSKKMTKPTFAKPNPKPNPNPNPFGPFDFHLQPEPRKPRSPVSPSPLHYDQEETQGEITFSSLNHSIADEDNDAYGRRWYVDHTALSQRAVDFVDKDITTSSGLGSLEDGGEFVTQFDPALEDSWDCWDESVRFSPARSSMGMGSGSMTEPPPRPHKRRSRGRSSLGFGTSSSFTTSTPPRQPFSETRNRDRVRARADSTMSNDDSSKSSPNPFIHRGSQGARSFNLYSGFSAPKSVPEEIVKENMSMRGLEPGVEGKDEWPSPTPKPKNEKDEIDTLTLSGDVEMKEAGEDESDKENAGSSLPTLAEELSAASTSGLGFKVTNDKSSTSEHDSHSRPPNPEPSSYYSQRTLSPFKPSTKRNRNLCESPAVAVEQPPESGSGSRSFHSNENQDSDANVSDEVYTQAQAEPGSSNNDYIVEAENEAGTIRDASASPLKKKRRPALSARDSVALTVPAPVPNPGSTSGVDADTGPTTSSTVLASRTTAMATVTTATRTTRSTKTGITGPTASMTTTTRTLRPRIAVTATAATRANAAGGRATTTTQGTKNRAAVGRPTTRTGAAVMTNNTTRTTSSVRTGTTGNVNASGSGSRPGSSTSIRSAGTGTNSRARPATAIAATTSSTSSVVAVSGPSVTEKKRKSTVEVVIPVHKRRVQPGGTSAASSTSGPASAESDSEADPRTRFTFQHPLPPTPLDSNGGNVHQENGNRLSTIVEGSENGNSAVGNLGEGTRMTTRAMARKSQTLADGQGGAEVASVGGVNSRPGSTMQATTASKTRAAVGTRTRSTTAKATRTAAAATRTKTTRAGAAVKEKGKEKERERRWR